MQLATFNAAKTALIVAYEQPNGVGSAGAIPWAAILQAILTALAAGGCIPKPATPAAVKAAVADDANSPYLEWTVHRELVTSVGRWRARQMSVSAIVTAIKTAAGAADDSLVSAIVEASAE